MGGTTIPMTKNREQLSRKQLQAKLVGTKDPASTSAENK